MLFRSELVAGNGISVEDKNKISIALAAASKLTTAEGTEVDLISPAE